MIHKDSAFFCFLLNDKTKFKHQHDVVYYLKSSEPFCGDNYVGETGRRIKERIKDHSGRDHASDHGETQY